MNTKTLALSDNLPSRFAEERKKPKPKPKPRTKQELLDATWKRVEDQIARYSFIYEGKPAVAVKIGRKPKNRNSRVPLDELQVAKVAIFDPHVLLKFLVSGGSPAMWLRVMDKDNPRKRAVAHTCRSPLYDKPQRLHVGRWIKDCSRKEMAISDDPTNPFDLREHKWIKVPAPEVVWSDYSPRETLEAREKLRRWPDWDLAQYLVHPGLLDLSEDGDIHTLVL